MIDNNYKSLSYSPGRLVPSLLLLCYYHVNNTLNKEIKELCTTIGSEGVVEGRNVRMNRGWKTSVGTSADGTILRSIVVTIQYYLDDSVSLNISFVALWEGAERVSPQSHSIIDVYNIRLQSQERNKQHVRCYYVWTTLYKSIAVRAAFCYVCLQW